MHIAINARPITVSPEGIGIYLINILNRLVRDGHQITLISPEEKIYWEGPTDQVKTLVVPEPPLNTRMIKRLAWEEDILPAALGSIKADIYHATHNHGIPNVPSLPTVLTIHDLIQLILASDKDHYYYYNFLIGLSAYRANQITCVSKFTAQDIARYFPEAKSKTTVIYNGVDHFSADAPTPVSHLTPNQYIAYIGGFGTRKNVRLLVAAFKTIHQRHPEFKLILAGAKINAYDDIVADIHSLNLDESVIFSGYLDRPQLGALLKDAFCSVYPSQYEGFGLPVIESMLQGCPVIAANNTSIPEVAGDAALLIETNNQQAIIDAFDMLLYDKEMRKRLVAKGLTHANTFNWEDTYQAVVRLYDEAIRIHHRQRT